MRNSNLVTWLGQMFLGFAMLVGGIEVAHTFWGLAWETVAGAGMISLAGLALAVFGELRERPRRLLRKARASLNLPAQWAVRFDKSVPHGGVLPLAVIRADGVRFVIDIQGERSADWELQDDGQFQLVGHDGLPLKNDPVTPLMNAAAAWGATAVLWLPDAAAPHNLRREGSNLIVVMGDARDLKHALRGAEIVPRWQSQPEASARPRQARRKSTASIATAELA